MNQVLKPNYLNFKILPPVAMSLQLSKMASHVGKTKCVCSGLASPDLWLRRKEDFLRRFVRNRQGKCPSEGDMRCSTRLAAIINESHQ